MLSCPKVHSGHPQLQIIINNNYAERINYSIIHDSDDVSGQGFAFASQKLATMIKTTNMKLRRVAMI